MCPLTEGGSPCRNGWRSCNCTTRCCSKPSTWIDTGGAVELLNRTNLGATIPADWDQPPDSEAWLPRSVQEALPGLLESPPDDRPLAVLAPVEQLNALATLATSLRRRERRLSEVPDRAVVDELVRHVLAEGSQDNIDKLLQILDAVPHEGFIRIRGLDQDLQLSRVTGPRPPMPAPQTAQTVGDVLEQAATPLGLTVPALISSSPRTPSWRSRAPHLPSDGERCRPLPSAPPYEPPLRRSR